MFIAREKDKTGTSEYYVAWAKKNRYRSTLALAHFTSLLCESTLFLPRQFRKRNTRYNNTSHSYEISIDNNPLIQIAEVALLAAG